MRRLVWCVVALIVGGCGATEPHPGTGGHDGGTSPFSPFSPADASPAMDARSDAAVPVLPEPARPQFWTVGNLNARLHPELAGPCARSGGVEMDNGGDELLVVDDLELRGS